VTSTLWLQRNGAVGFIDWLDRGDVTSGAAIRVVLNFDDFPSVVQKCSGCTQSPTTPNETVKKPILLTCNVEKVTVIAQFVDLPGHGKRCVRAVALQSIEIRE
jgi:hypothetical protein